MTRVALGVTTPKDHVVGPRHVQAAVLEALFDVVGLAAQPARHRGELPGGEHIDEGVVGDAQTVVDQVLAL